MKYKSILKSIPNKICTLATQGADVSWSLYKVPTRTNPFYKQYLK